MKTVTITYKDCQGKSKTGTFEVYDRTQIERSVRYELLSRKNAVLVQYDDFDGDYGVEGQAAEAAGVNPKNAITVQIA